MREKKSLTLSEEEAQSSLEKYLGDYRSKQRLFRFRKKYEKTKEMVLDDAKSFLIFSFAIVITILIFYSKTLDDVAASFVLFILWGMFWRHSGTVGKTLLVTASLVGFVHEIIGVYYGWFTYATGMVMGVPLWVLPGYGAIFWSAENFWRHAEKKDMFPEKYFRAFFALCVAGIFALDLFVFRMPSGGVWDIAYFILIMLLFSERKEQHLAVTTGLITGFDEALGEVLGAWYHGPQQYAKFSLLELVPSYVFLLWICLVIVHSILGDRKITRREFLIALLAVFVRFGREGLVFLGLWPF